MDAKTYERVREEFLRLHELPEAELQDALEQISRDEPDIAAELRKLLDGGSSASGEDPGFEDAIQRGLAEGAQELVPTLRLSPGTEVGPFSIDSYIDGGGFGEVYLARQDDPDREVALKIIKPGMDSAQVIRRFRQEREALARMDHPSVARFYQAGTTAPELGSRPYFAMEFVHGPKITGYCIRQDLSLEARIELFIEVCAAVQHAHSKGVVHRDLKPSNVLIADVEGQPVPKVIDFGIAKALDHRLGQMSVNTIEGQFLGTPAYMSPEQASGGDIDTSTDVYALGVMLYELLAGCLPFDSRTFADLPLAEIQRVIRESTPTRPSQKVIAAGKRAASEARVRVAIARRLERDLDDIVMQCLEKEPQLRYATANALAEDLQRFLRDEPVEAVRANRFYGARKWVKRHRVAAGVGTLVCALVLSSLSTAAIGFGKAWNDNRKLVDTTKTLDQVQAELVDSQAKRDANAHEAKTLANMVAQTQGNLQAVGTQLRAAERDIEEAQQRLSSREAELERLAAEAEQQSEELEQAREMTAREQARAQESERRRSAQQTQFETAQREFAAQEAERRKDIESLNDEIARLDEATEQSERELQTAQRERDAMQRLYSDVRRAVSQLTERTQFDEDQLIDWAYSKETQGSMRIEFLTELVESSLAKPDYARAVAHQAELVSVSVGLIGSDDLRTLEQRVRLAELMILASDIQGAQLQLDRVREATSRTPENAPEIEADLLLATARLELARGSLDAARDFSAQVIEILTSRYGNFDHRTAEAVFVRGLVHMEARETDLAISDYQDVIRLDDAQFGDDTREILAMACNNLAYLKRERGRVSLSEGLLDRGSRVASQAWDVLDWRTALVDAHYGYVLSMKGDFIAAEAKLKSAEGVLSSSLGADHRETQAVYRTLANSYRRRNTVENTEKYSDEIELWESKVIQRAGPS